MPLINSTITPISDPNLPRSAISKATSSAESLTSLELVAATLALTLPLFALSSVVLAILTVSSIVFKIT